jgi:hypothetical protein
MGLTWDAQAAHGEEKGAHRVRVASWIGLSHLRHEHLSAAEEVGLETQALAAYTAYVRDVVGAVGPCADCADFAVLGLEGWITCLTV